MSDFEAYSMNNLLAYTKTEDRELPVYNTRNLIKIFKMYDNNVVFSFMVVFASVYCHHKHYNAQV